MVSPLLPSYQLGNKISWLSWVEQGHYVTYPSALVPCCLSAWKEKAARMKHNWAQSQHGIRSRLDRDSQHRVQLGPRRWKMLLGPYSASGMFSRNEPAPEPRSDKMEPGTGPGLFFGSTTPKPNSRDTTNPTLCLTSWVTAGTVHLRSTFGSIVHSSMVQLSL